MLEVEPEIAALVSTIPIGTLDAEVLGPMREGIGALPVELSDKVERKDYVVPGDPDASIMVYRMSSIVPGVMMPQIGRTVVDVQGVALVADWIGSLDGGGCP